MSTLKRVLCACAAACALGGAAPGHAQLMDLTFSSSHSATVAGLPQPGLFRPRIPTTGLPGPLVSGTWYSTLTSNDPRNFIFVPAGMTVDSQLGGPTGRILVPAQTPLSNTLNIRLDAVAGLTSQPFDDLKAFQYKGNCFAVGDPNTAVVGIHPVLVMHRCDALNISLTMNGVTAMASSAEGSPVLRVVIPAIGLDRTGPVDGRTTFTQFDRGDSLSAIYDAAVASGQADKLAARLLGMPDTFVAPRGSLPEGGNLIKGTMTVGDKTRSFGADNPGQIIAYLLFNRGTEFTDFGLPYSGECHRTTAGGPVTGTCTAASATFTFLGIEVQASTGANSPDGSFKVPSLDLEFTSAGATSRENAIDQLVKYATDTVDRSKLTEAYARYLAENSPNDPLVGNPLSAQGQLTRLTLDLDTPSAALNETEGAKGGSGGRAGASEPAGWMVGGRAGHLEAGDSTAEYVDAVFERGFRFREGSRMRLKLSAPVSYIDYGSSKGGNGGRTATVGLRAALEAPLIDGRWVVEPSASASAFYSSNEISSGALYALGLSSRYKLAPVGRGHLIIGNAITWSSTLHIEAGDFATPKIQNTSLRNGVAYQVPYGRFMGRQGTVRASYTYTHVFGDDLFVDEYHDVSLSYGVGSREASVRQVGEILRFGVNGSFGHDFTAVAATLGYHF